MDNKPLTPLPDWVQEQQHQSWQIEILIATGLIFFLTRNYHKMHLDRLIIDQDSSFYFPFSSAAFFKE